MQSSRVQIWLARWTFITKKGNLRTTSDVITPFFDGVAVMLGIQYDVRKAAMLACSGSLISYKTLQIDPITNLPAVICIQYKKYISDSNLDLKGYLSQHKIYYKDEDNDF